MIEGLSGASGTVFLIPLGVLRFSGGIHGPGYVLFRGLMRVSMGAPLERELRLRL